MWNSVHNPSLSDGTLRHHPTNTIGRVLRDRACICFCASAFVHQLSAPAAAIRACSFSSTCTRVPACSCPKRVATKRCSLFLTTHHGQSSFLHRRTTIQRWLFRCPKAACSRQEDLAASRRVSKDDEEESTLLVTSPLLKGKVRERLHSSF